MRAWVTAAGAAAAAVIWACGGAGEPEMAAAPDPDEHARRLAAEMVIVDTHIDVPYRLREGMEDISQATEGGDFDYPRARQGGLDAAFMSVYVPASYQESGGAKQVAEELIEMVEGFARDAPDKFTLAVTPGDVRQAHADGKIALPMGMENGAPIETLEDVAHFAGRGIRYVTLTHSENNQICDSSYADEKQWNGLSPFGREVVAEMNRLGVMIDVSHVSDDTFWQVMEASRAPVIASHSSCRAFTPGWERNMSDEMIERLGENGGVLQINFGSAFLTAEAHEQATRYWSEVRAFLEESGVESDSPEAEAFRDQWWRGNPRIYADVSDVVAHIDHVVKLAGVDHVGLGSDYDGVGDSLPTGLKDVSQYPNLIRALLDAGYSEADVAKICGENLLRVWSEVERVAAELQDSGS